MKFSIIVPAFNEEGSIEDLARRCAALDPAALAVESIEVIVVDDGSTDATAKKARAVDGVSVISHPGNRGYGAAIKTGFEHSHGDLLGFLDGDGTCDPAFFQTLLHELQERSLDCALGSRMHPGSKMPALRFLGNRFFRGLVSALGGEGVSDVASGMRVLRRDSLERFYPLPDGLHFTPAMSVRAILDPQITIGEIEMPYEERVGKSKLSVVGDGLRFLRVILETALTYRPLRMLGFTAGLFALFAAALLGLELGGPAAPLQFYIERNFIADWMVFRLMLVAVLLASSVFLITLGLVAQSLVGLINRESEAIPDEPGLRTAILDRLPLWGGLSIFAALLINKRPLVSYWQTGEIPGEFWVFPVVGGLFAIVGIELLAFWVVNQIAAQLRERERYRGRFADSAIKRNPTL
ncbi:MAG: hypothetical protein COB53_00310 [Elusimicrobia bacterium]|nr:MAG: hypothetical protein COB53_00310 [Elusimicrobiota bacterium]